MSLSLSGQLPALFAFPLGTACRLFSRRDFSLFAQRSLRVERFNAYFFLLVHTESFFLRFILFIIRFVFINKYHIDSFFRSRLTRSFDDSFRAMSQSIIVERYWSIPWRDDPLSSHAEDAESTSHDRPVTTETGWWCNAMVPTSSLERAPSSIDKR